MGFRLMQPRFPLGRTLATPGALALGVDLAAYLRRHHCGDWGDELDAEDKQMNALHGLYRALLANIVQGVSSGFEKNLEIVGVGYRVTQQNKDAVFQLGYSHTITFTPPEGITIEVIDATKLKVKGINKQQVGQVAANIRELRPPEPYKGKGIRYAGEQVRKKAGKTGKK